MVKAKDTAKEAPKARTSKAKEKAAEKALLAGALTEAPAPLDAEARKTRLKNLITLGKERGYLTYAEINDHLPDDVVDAEQHRDHHLHLQRHEHPGLRRSPGCRRSADVGRLCRLFR